MHSGTGKNAADLLLTVDAMARAGDRQCDAVVIVSSDGDFRHLAEHLRGRDLTVLGIGGGAASARFKASCRRFEIIGRSNPLCPDPPFQPATGAKASASLPQSAWQAAIVSLLCDAEGDAGMTTQEIGTLMGVRHGAHIRRHPDGTWKAYFEKRHGLFRTSAGPDGTRIHLRHPQTRIRPHALAAE